MRGGGPGAPTELIVNAGTPRERRHDKIYALPLEPGDVVTLLTSGAGGYGDLFTRDPEAVPRDVERGVVTVEAAARAYGVVLAAGRTLVVDEEATRAARAARGDSETGVGPERPAWESVFAAAAVDRPRPSRPRPLAVHSPQRSPHWNGHPDDHWQRRRRPRRPLP
ncbi:hypothetical protein FXF51_00860 [Nonomuraea sp. PA05]|nr:hypothetical protein FXF51_00860 [Nonomuraea sp. PA05]